MKLAMGSIPVSANTSVLECAGALFTATLQIGLLGLQSLQSKIAEVIDALCALNLTRRRCPRGKIGCGRGEARDQRQEAGHSGGEAHDGRAEGGAKWR